MMLTTLGNIKRSYAVMIEVKILNGKVKARLKQGLTSSLLHDQAPQHSLYHQTYYQH